MATTVGLLHLSLNVSDAQSLKDKRRTVKSFKDRLASRHNVSVAEIDSLDHRSRAVLAIAMVGNDRRYLEGIAQSIINAATSRREMIVLNTQIEWL